MFVDWIAPGICGAIVVAAELYLHMYTDKCLALRGSAGILNSISNALGVLGGFYIAALSIVISLERPWLDLIFRDGLQVYNYRHETRKFGWSPDLTRRRYLGYIFGYLSYSSLVLMLIAFLGNNFPINVSYAMKLVFLGFFSFFCAQVILVSFYGLYYLVDRINYGKTHVYSK